VGWWYLKKVAVFLFPWNGDKLLIYLYLLWFEKLNIKF
jgi:hypothetical protein